MQIETSVPEPTPASIADLTGQFLAVVGAKPVLVWYNAQGERIELSGRVWHNWISKSANLLLNHADNPSQGSITLDAPVHWKTLAISLAAWRANFLVNIEAGVEAEDAPEPDILVTSRPFQAAGKPGSTADPIDRAGQTQPWQDQHGNAELDYANVMRVDLSNLGSEFSGDIDPLDIDYAAEVRLEADTFTPITKQSPAIADLIATLAPQEVTGAVSGDHAVVLLEGVAEERNPPQLAAVLATALEVWQRRGVLVLTQAGTAGVDRIAQMEGATLRTNLSSE